MNILTKIYNKMFKMKIYNNEQIKDRFFKSQLGTIIFSGMIFVWLIGLFCMIVYPLKFGSEWAIPISMAMSIIAVIVVLGMYHLVFIVNSQEDETNRAILEMRRLTSIILEELEFQNARRNRRNK